MNNTNVSSSLDTFLTKKLSGTVFSWKEIWNLLLPGVLDSLSIMFINMLITALISKNGEASVAAVSLVGPVTGLVVNFFGGISNGGSVVVAQCCGKKDKPLTTRSISMTIGLTVMLGLAVCIPMILMSQSILTLLYPDAASDVMQKAVVFFSGCLFSIIIFTVYTAVFAVLRGLGESKRCLILSIIINVAYLLLSILFLNILKMDIYGSVYALFLARLIGTVAAVAALFFWHPPIRMSIREFFCFDRSLSRSILKVGIPMSFEQMVISLSGIVSGMYMVTLGTTALATNAIATSLLGLLYSPSMSIGGLAVTVVGRCVGAKKPDEARHYAKVCNHLSLLLMILSSLVFYPMLPYLLQQYNPSAEVSTVATQIAYCCIPFLLLVWPGSTTLPNSLRAASDTLFPTVLSLSVLWLITIGLGYILAIPCGLGLWGVWIANWTSWTVRCIGFRLRFHFRKWKLDASLVS